MLNGQPFNWSMAPMLHNVVVNIVIHTHPRAIPQARITMRKVLNWFFLVCQSSTINNLLIIGDYNSLYTTLQVVASCMHQTMQ